MEEIIIPECNELGFEHDKHVYTIGGRVLPSVSQVMNPLSKSHYGNVPHDVLQAAADRGTAVHSAIELNLKYGIEDIEGDLKGYLDAFVDFAKGHTITPVCMEHKFYHKLLQYAGTIDCLCMMDGKLTLLDFKTTEKVIKYMTRVQLEAYKQMLRSQGIEIEQKFIIQISNNGKFHAEQHDLNDTEAWKIFTDCLDLYRYIEKNNKTYGGIL
ncbi:MAG: hypothetical protein LUD47_03255 [Clostridia bacterium]|nr:hypothetical protein [Clostridia bacterium]